MDIEKLFMSCRIGDLDSTRYLVEIKDIDVNVRDNWDSTPLYYACLCGHLPVVKYLIEVGARCEANTFDGERCLYGALTVDIKNTLVQHRMITVHTIKRNAYQEFLRRLYESGEGSDFSFICNNEVLKLHRCILCSRSPYFAMSFSSRWANKEQIVLNNNLIELPAINAVMKYIYTGMFECSFEMVDRCLLIAKSCKLPLFKEKVDKALERAQCFLDKKQGRVKITRVVIEPEDSDNRSSVESNLLELAQMTLPSSIRVWPTTMPFGQDSIPLLPDICFLIDDLRFMCHKIFFSERSEYFKILFRYNLNEIDREEFPPKVRLREVSPNIFAAIISYLYANHLTISQENVFDLLSIANMYLLPGLVRHCGVYMGDRLTIENVIDVHNVSRTFQLPRLEDQCIEFMAKYFFYIAEQQSFQNLILRDAADVTRREETDSVIVVDELRYHISSHLKTLSDIEEAKMKLNHLENVLEDLDIEA